MKFGFMTLRATSMLKDLDTGEMTDLDILFFILTSMLSLSLSFTHTHIHTHPPQHPEEEREMSVSSPSSRVPRETDQGW